MEKKSVEGRSAEEIETKFIGLNVPLSLHREFREVANRQGMTGTELLRRLIIRHLDGVKK